MKAYHGGFRVALQKAYPEVDFSRWKGTALFPPPLPKNSPHFPILRVTRFSRFFHLTVWRPRELPEVLR